MYQHQSNIMIKISILKIRGIKIQNTRFRNKKHPLSFTKTPNQKYRKHPFCMTKNTRRVQQYVLMVVKLKTHGLTTENMRFQVSKHSFWHYSNTRFQCTKTPVFIHKNTRFRVWKKPVLICYNTHSRILKTPVLTNTRFQKKPGFKTPVSICLKTPVFKPGSTTTEKPVFNS